MKASGRVSKQKRAVEVVGLASKQSGNCTLVFFPFCLLSPLVSQWVPDIQLPEYLSDHLRKAGRSFPFTGEVVAAES
jgi:hypothetical protein